jgi:hypothetical protein
MIDRITHEDAQYAPLLHVLKPTPEWIRCGGK